MTETAHEGVFLGDWLSWTPQSVVPSPWNHHIPFFAWMFATLQPGLSVEVGSGGGESFRALCQISERFSPNGRLIGVDQWAAQRRMTTQRNAEYEQLNDYCSTRHASSAALIRMDINEAAGQFEDSSIDLLHVAALTRGTEIGGLDLAAWAPKVRPGGLIVITSASREPDDASRKAWQQLAEWYPATSVALPGLVGVAQSPVEGEASLVELLSGQATCVSSLFRALGERIDYRHLVGSEPVSPSSLRSYISDLMKQHAEDVQRVEAQYRVARESVDRELASVSERLLERAHEIRNLEAEIDMLMAKIAAQAAAHERHLSRLADDITHLQWRLETETAELLRRQTTEAAQLHAEIAKREERIQALTHTASWRITMPLRKAQYLRMKLARRPR